MTVDEKRKKIAEMLVLFSEIFDKEISEAFSRMYISCLENYPWDKIHAAATQIIRTKTFNKFPLPAEFIQQIDPPEEMDVRIHRALEKVFDMIERYGAYSTVEFDDPVIHRTLIDLHGSWVEACFSRRSCRTDKDNRFWRKDFETTYARIVKSGSSAEPPRLIGIHDRQNSEKGYIAAGLVKVAEPMRLPNHGATPQTHDNNPSISERHTDQKLLEHRELEMQRC